LNISGEVYLHIQQNLAAIAGTRLEDIQQVHSHYMAINQCREYFVDFPHMKLVDSEDTALSMKMVADRQSKSLAAIGSKLAAELYGLNILAESIETNKKNYTRFLVVEYKKDSTASNYDKASLAILLPHQKGSLAKVLSMIDFYHINLSKIESVPIIGEPWHYLFYIDVLFEDSKVYQQMLASIQPMVDKLQILGEYVYGAQSFKEINQSTI
jgi:prephenate dehydratase